MQTVYIVMNGRSYSGSYVHDVVYTTLDKDDAIAHAQKLQEKNNVNAKNGSFQWYANVYEWCGTTSKCLKF